LAGTDELSLLFAFIADATGWDGSNDHDDDDDDGWLTPPCFFNQVLKFRCSVGWVVGGVYILLGWAGRVGKIGGGFGKGRMG